MTKSQCVRCAAALPSRDTGELVAAGYEVLCDVSNGLEFWFLCPACVPRVAEPVLRIIEELSRVPALRDFHWPDFYRIAMKHAKNTIDNQLKETSK